MYEQHQIHNEYEAKWTVSTINVSKNGNLWALSNALGLIIAYFGIFPAAKKFHVTWKIIFTQKNCSAFAFICVKKTTFETNERVWNFTAVDLCLHLF